MDPKLKKILRGISLEIRRLLEGYHDERGEWVAGDLEKRLNGMGVWRDREPRPIEELPHLSPEDKAARRLVDGYLKLREEAGVERKDAVAEFVRESSYTWANRLFALRCMEAREIIDEVVLQKDAYGGRSMVHNRFAKKDPQACAGEDDGLFAVLFEEFGSRAAELPVLFDPNSPAVALRPSVAALKRTVALLSGRESVRGQEAAKDDVFSAADAFGWAYQFWNAEEQKRVFELVRTKKDAKIEGTDIVPATQFYTEPYMVKFLVQNSLGALWMGMYPKSKLREAWGYYVKDADRAPAAPKPVREITFLDPAEGSGHFHLEAFDIFYSMYEEEAAREHRTLSSCEIAASILNNNLYGIDIDGRSVQIAAAALWMKAKQRAPELEAGHLTSFHKHLVATNIRLPKGQDHLKLFLEKRADDEVLRPALELVFGGLEHADELGALVQIEELVDAVLRRLKEESDTVRGVPVQRGLFGPTLVQASLPVGVESYDDWKRDTLKRLGAHLDAEARAADAVQAFFGESAGKGLAFLDVLARRYDVVAANPPYMGSKNMGLEVKAYVSTHFSLGKRDLYAAFIARCLSFARVGGRVGVVTLQSWMFSPSFLELRKGLLEGTSIEAVCSLGRYAFSDADPPGLPALAVISCVAPRPGRRMFCARVSGPTETEVQAQIVRDSARGVASVFRPTQETFLRVPAHPIVFWLGEGLLKRMVDARLLGDIAAPRQGLKTANQDRYLRRVWEVPRVGGRWRLLAKAGRFQRWCGLLSWVVDWNNDAAVLRRDPRARFQSSQYYFREGVTYSAACRGKLGARLLPSGVVFDSASPSLFPATEERVYLTALLSSRIASFVIRALGTTIVVGEGTAGQIPVVATSGCDPLIGSAVNLKMTLVSRDHTEFDFRLGNMTSVAVDECAVALAVVEGCIERRLFGIYELPEAEIAAIVGETGSPAGWFGLLKGYDGVSVLTAGPETVREQILAELRDYPRRSLSGDELGDLRRRLRQLYELGPGGESAEEALEPASLEIETEEDGVPTGGNLVLPAETFVEELSQKLKLHPISVYWLLQEGISGEGWRCQPEEKRLAEDRFTVLVLLLLGHRWPKQLEAGESLSPWADHDGIVPVTDGGGETSLVERLRNLLAEQVAGEKVAALERKFGEVVGTPLPEWLTDRFFKFHIGRFDKRPVAWQVETNPKGGGKGKKLAPGFSCLIYYHKVDGDLLPKIRTHYVGHLRSGYEVELRSLEKLANPTPEQQGRKLVLEQWVEELKAFDQKLEAVGNAGFGPEPMRLALRQYGIEDALLSLMACWLRRLEEVISGQWPVGSEGKAAVSVPLAEWCKAAEATGLHEDLAKWIDEAFKHLDHFCSAVGPEAPKEPEFTTDPTSKDLAPLVCASPAKTVDRVLDLACDRWWHGFEVFLLDPLKEELKGMKAEHEQMKEQLELDEVKRDYDRHMKLADRRDKLKREMKRLKEEIEDKTDKGKELRSEIEAWSCPEAGMWEDWLGTQSLFDGVASLDGKRKPPVTIAEFVAQESAYAPDINDGVRVNIAPLQKAGLLHADVLDFKDVDKAIADRAEWRAHERRWVREGKLPQPGWWPTANGCQ